jgi:hypothetical protein
VNPSLARAAELGPYFQWAPLDTPSSWRPWADLADGDVLADRVSAARGALATMSGLPESSLPERAVASVAFLGYAARVLSPLVGAVALTGTLPVVDSLWWRPVPAGPLPIAYAGAGTATAADAPTLMRTAVGALLTPVLDACRTRFRLSPLVLWGNVASALGGAASMITDADPAAGLRATSLVAAMLGLAPLTGTATLVRPDPAHARRFLVRNNCCLYYRIPGGGTCGDCVLTPEAERRRAWEAVLARP